MDSKKKFKKINLTPNPGTICCCTALHEFMSCCERCIASKADVEDKKAEPHLSAAGKDKRDSFISVYLR